MALDRIPTSFSYTAMLMSWRCRSFLVTHDDDDASDVAPDSTSALPFKIKVLCRCGAAFATRNDPWRWCQLEGCAASPGGSATAAPCDPVGDKHIR